MGNKIFTYKDKAFNTIYRIILFVCLAASATAVFGIISIVVNQNNDIILEKNVSYIMAMTYGYYVAMIGSAAAVVFSILSYKSGSFVSLFFRTASSLGIFILDLCGISFMSILKLMCNVINKYGIDYLKEENPSPEAVGLTQADIEKLQNIDNLDENIYVLLFAGLFFGAFVYFILSLTSLHSLFKQRKIPVSNGVPMDDELAQYYDNSSSGYDNINNL